MAATMTWLAYRRMLVGDRGVDQTLACEADGNLDRVELLAVDELRQGDAVVVRQNVVAEAMDSVVAHAQIRAR